MQQVGRAGCIMSLLARRAVKGVAGVSLGVKGVALGLKNAGICSLAH